MGMQLELQWSKLLYLPKGETGMAALVKLYLPLAPEPGSALRWTHAECGLQSTQL